MRTLLVDDEEKSIRALRSLLQRYCPTEPVLMCSTAAPAVRSK